MTPSRLSKQKPRSTAPESGASPRTLGRPRGSRDPSALTPLRPRPCAPLHTMLLQNYIQIELLLQSFRYNVTCLRLTHCIIPTRHFRFSLMSSLYIYYVFLSLGIIPLIIYHRRMKYLFA